MTKVNTSPVYNAILAKIERDERVNAIQYDLARVSNWQRRAPLTFGRRAPGLVARLLRWLGL